MRQLSLDLEFTLGNPVAVGTLNPGERFMRDDAEGQLLHVAPGSVSVKLLREQGKWEKTQWSPATIVRTLRA